MTHGKLNLIANVILVIGVIGVVSSIILTNGAGRMGGVIFCCGLAVLLQAIITYGILGGLATIIKELQDLNSRLARS